MRFAGIPSMDLTPRWAPLGEGAGASPPEQTQNAAASIKVINWLPLAGFGVKASPERNV